MELWEEPSLWLGDGKPSPWFGDIIGVTWVPASPKLLVLQTLGSNADGMTVTQKRARKTYMESGTAALFNHTLCYNLLYIGIPCQQNYLKMFHAHGTHIRRTVYF